MILSIVLQTNLDPDSVIDIIFSFWLDVLLVQGFATKVEQKDPDLVQGDIACKCAMNTPSDSVFCVLIGSGICWPTGACAWLP